MTSLAEQYRAERRQQSASMIYNPPVQAPARPSIYADSPQYGGLAQYTSASRSKFLPKPGKPGEPGETALAYRNRTGPLLHHLRERLPADEMAQVEEAYRQADEQVNGAQVTDVNARLAARRDALATDPGHLRAAQAESGGSGVMGRVQERAAIVGSRFGGRQPEAMGHMAYAALQSPGQPQIASASDINAILAQREAARQAQEPQRTNVADLRSSGTGWVTR